MPEDYVKCHRELTTGRWLSVPSAYKWRLMELSHLCKPAGGRCELPLPRGQSRNPISRCCDMLPGNRREAREAIEYLSGDGTPGDPEHPPTIEFRVLNGTVLDPFSGEPWTKTGRKNHANSDLGSRSSSAPRSRSDKSERCIVVIPHWHLHQPLSPSTQRMRDLRARRKEERELSEKGDVTEVTEGDVTCDAADQSRGDQKRSEENGVTSDAAPGPKKTTGKTKKGTRIPDPFEVTPEMYAWAREDKDVRFDRAHVDSYTAEFIDYWKSVSGQKGVKVLWESTWRNRMRAKREYKPALPEPRPEMGPPPKGPPPMDPAVAARAAEIREEMAQGKTFDLEATLAGIGKGPPEQSAEGDS